MNENELVWIKARRSADQGQCVELANGDGVVYVRDSKDPTGGALTIPKAALRAWLAAAKTGELDDLI